MEVAQQQPNRLVPINEAKHIIGVKAHSTFYELVKRGELPPLIKRGRNSFQLESDLQAYIDRLAATRGSAEAA